jgi:hypothetical protein
VDEACHGTEPKLKSQVLGTTMGKLHSNLEHEISHCHNDEERLDITAEMRTHDSLKPMVMCK